MAAKNRFNAVENATQFIGKGAGRILAFFILVSMIGWIAQQLDFDARLLKLYPKLSDLSVGSIIGVIASLILLKGIKGLKFISQIAVIPLLLLLFSIALYPDSPEKFASQINNKNIFGISNLSVVISVWIGAIVDYPTFFRHSKTIKDSVIALTIIFLVITGTELCGIFIFKTLFLDDNGIREIITQDNIKSLLFALFILISMLTNVCWNIYAASVGWESLFPIFKDRTEYAVIGLVAVVSMGYSTVMKFLVFTSNLFEAVISALAGVLIVFFLYYGRKIPQNVFRWAYLSWFFAAAFGILPCFDILLPKKMCVFASLITGLVISTISIILKKFTKKPDS